ncbi:alpha/beta fold hydrolase [Rhodopirellula sp.]|jgi:pimeloyl-ACP methyl ester carboxylesterase|nr:alpha/beta fold hydrolase [Rhodopirellula sp.]
MTRKTLVRTIVSRKSGVLAFLFLLTASSWTTLFAQGKKGEEDPRLEARPVTLKSKDGMELRVFYFPSEQKKNATTVLLVHEWGGQASPYYKLVTALNKAGCAVIAPDYRGHGGSKEYVNVRGDKAELDPDKMSRKDVEAIVAMDLEKVKGFLKDENNDGYLNLNALVVIGVGEGAVLGNLWAMRDWGFPSIGRVKQGQDVKGLVMISPAKQAKGLPIEPSLNDNNLLMLPTLIMAGEGSLQASEARRMAGRIEARKKRVGRGEVSGLSVQMLDSDLANALLVTEVAAAIPAIVSFVTTEVKGNDPKNPWVERD